MSAATQAKTARQRAIIAARLIKTIKPWPQGFGLDNNRGFGDCFMMNDGEEVRRILFGLARQDAVLLAALKIHKPFREDIMSQIEGQA